MGIPHNHKNFHSHAVRYPQHTNDPNSSSLTTNYYSGLPKLKLILSEGFHILSTDLSLFLQLMKATVLTESYGFFVYSL